jgi:hypothetical protein
MKHEAKNGRRPEQGAALIESALVLPLLLLLMINAVNFGTYIFGWITVNNAARAAAEYRIYNGVAVGFPATPSSSQVQSLVITDTSSLHSPLFSDLSVTICSNRNGTPTCAGTPPDPEPGSYTLYSVDVAYNFTPLFGSFSLPSLGISLTILPNTIHRQVLMRSMQ